ncbi:MAG: hypothetical protein QOI32_92 [Thermoleophilaceae bacterium]|jgi:hypothetical protein|nr:hypothetical protein [Thermoleophilaceae bacterium]
MAPVAVGGVAAAIVVLVFAEAEAEETFFSVSAQVLPVILLALVIEARAVGAPVMRAPKRMPLGRLLERVRRVLEGVLVVALLAAEGYALDIISDAREGPADPWVVWLGLTWGFVTAAVLTVLGTKRPRATIDVKSETTSDGHTIVRLALGNQFGDIDVAPVLNMYLQPGHGRVYKCKADGTDLIELIPFKSSDPTRPLLSECDAEWKCLGEPVTMAAGGTVHKAYRIEPGEHGEQQYEVRVRLDHVHLPGGRIRQEAKVPDVEE